MPTRPRTWLLLVLLACTSAHAGEPPVAAADTHPVATVRVAFDREGITAIAVEGLADAATGRKVSAGDPVRVASISKLVTAIGVMLCVILLIRPNGLFGNLIQRRRPARKPDPTGPSA